MLYERLAAAGDVYDHYCYSSFNPCSSIINDEKTNCEWNREWEQNFIVATRRESEHAPFLNFSFELELMVCGRL